MERHAHWLLRIALASVFLYHGLTKFPQAAGLAGMLGMPVALVLLIAVLETLGGALVLLGGIFGEWMTRLGALFIIPVMLGAILLVHWGQWSFTPSATHPMGGIEFQVTLLLTALYLFLKGSEDHDPVKHAPPEQRRRAA